MRGEDGRVGGWVGGWGDGRVDGEGASVIMESMGMVVGV